MLSLAILLYCFLIAPTLGGGGRGITATRTFLPHQQLIRRDRPQALGSCFFGISERGKGGGPQIKMCIITHFIACFLNKQIRLLLSIGGFSRESVKKNGSFLQIYSFKQYIFQKNIFSSISLKLDTCARLRQMCKKRGRGKRDEAMALYLYSYKSNMERV